MKTAPIALRRMLKPEDLISTEWCDSLRFLGSFRPGAFDAESRIIKLFKEPADWSQALQPSLARAYAALVSESLGQERPDALVRVLASSETQPNDTRPLALLTARLSKTLEIPDRTSLFFHSDVREPMRYVEKLAGPEALRARLNYALQDLFLRPAEVGQRVLLVDDIYNLGATARIYSAALKQFCGAEQVTAMNLAATRFRGGRDGRGDLRLDLQAFAAHAGRELTRAVKREWRGSNPFQTGWSRRDGSLLHASNDCPALEQDRTSRTIKFVLGPESELCPECNTRGWRRRLSDFLGR